MSAKALIMQLREWAESDAKGSKSWGDPNVSVQAAELAGSSNACWRLIDLIERNAQEPESFPELLTITPEDRLRGAISQACAWIENQNTGRAYDILIDALKIR